MTFCKRILSLLASLLGLIGGVGCIAAIAGVWIINARLSDTTETVFGTIDGSLVDIQERVAQTQNRVEGSKITTEGMEKSLRDWTKREVGERLALRLEVAEKTERLASALQQADDWLDVSESSVELVNQALSIGRSTGAPMENTSVDGLVDDIATLRIQLAEATELVARVQELTGEAGEEKSLKEQIEKSVQVTLRLIATFGSVTSRLESFEGRLTKTRKDVPQLKATTLQWILVVAIVLTLFLAWMAAGQIALCLLAWKSFRRTWMPSRESTVPIAS